jgi:hypothetical protein
MRYAKLTIEKNGEIMNTASVASVALVLQKLESVMAVARAMNADARACGDTDAQLAELFTTLDAVERDMQQLLRENRGALSDLPPPDKPNQKKQSPYYWEDD